MKGLSETFASLQQEEGTSHVEIVLRLFREMFFQSVAPGPTVTAAAKLQVFAAGLPRSGTGSLAVALAELGYNPCHGPGILELEPILREHYAGLASHGDMLRYQQDRGHDAQGLDQLGWKLYKEATEEFPDAKIILTEHPRGSLAWAESFSSFAPDHIYYFGHAPFSYLSSLRQAIVLQREFLSYIGGGSDDPRDPRYRFPASDLAKAYERHNEEVKRTVPNDRLLVFTPTEGWEPLCRFLEIDETDCPTTPYPHMTDRQMMIVMSKVAMVITCVWPFVPVLGVVLILYVYRRKRQRKHKVA